MLAYSVEKDGGYLILRCSDGRELRTDQWDDVVGFLLVPTKNNMAMVWNVDNVTDDIISVLPMNVQVKVEKGGRVYTPDNRKLYYQPSRVFSINHVNIYGLSRYSDDVVTDVGELEVLGGKVLEAYQEFGIDTDELRTLSSPVAVCGQILDEIDYPRACDLPDIAFSMLEKCDEKRWEEWREVYKLGHWNANEVVDIDLVSAYGYLMSKLPDLRGAKFFESDEMPEQYSWGELEGKLTINADVTPFLYVGTWQDSITTEQLWLIDKYEWGEFKLKHGWFFQLPRYYNLPFRKTMEELYRVRQNDNPLVQKIGKAISVGIGGKLSQKFEDGRLGDGYNPIYSRLLTSRCSTKLADFIWRRGLQKQVVSVLVDGCLVEGIKPSELGYSGSHNGMGSWRVNPSSNFLVASLLYQWDGLNTKKPNGQGYDEVMESIRSKPNHPVIGGNVDLNLLNHDSRIFDDLPRCGGDLLKNKYYSKPVSVAVS